MEPPAPETWPTFSERTAEIESAIPGTPLPEITDDIDGFRKNSNPPRTDPVEGVSETDVTMKNLEGDLLRANVYYPTNNKESVGVYAYFHYGGFLLGSPELLESQSRDIVKKHNLVAIAPSYRFAPENPFPAGVNDVWAWTQWIAHNIKSLKIGADPAKGYILAGESVGGNMAFVSALRARDDPSAMKGVQVTGLHVLSAQLCSDKAIPEKYRKWYTSYEQNKDAPILSRKVQNGIRDNLKPDEKSWKWNPIIHPKGLGGMPPTFIQTPGWDPTRDDNLIAEMMLRDAGSKTRLNLYQGASHVFWVTFPDLAVTKQFAKDREEGVEWLKREGK